jgi:hypothetical protein
VADARQIDHVEREESRKGWDDTAKGRPVERPAVDEEHVRTAPETPVRDALVTSIEEALGFREGAQSFALGLGVKRLDVHDREHGPPGDARNYLSA